MIVEHGFFMDFLWHDQLDAPAFIVPQPSKRDSLFHFTEMPETCGAYQALPRSRSTFYCML
jgi:hypothetical protein